MNIAIIGYGRMGKIIERTAKDRGHNVVSLIDPNCEDAQFDEVNEESMKDADVCIDFTIPDVALENAINVSKHNVNIVMGTTGWYDQMDKMEKIVKDNKTGLIWSGNFSIGVNIFFRIINSAAKIINNIDNYDIFAYEMHHKGKKDSPSGTANMIADMLIKNIDRKEKVVVDKLDRQIEPGELHLASVRGGSVPGTHSVSFDSNADTIELKHTARSREGFALGAVMAAEWIDKKKGFFHIDDLMKDIIK